MLVVGRNCHIIWFVLDAQSLLAAWQSGIIPGMLRATYGIPGIKSW